MKRIAVYGCYGLTGSLVVRELVTRGYEPVLCGRDADALSLLSRNLGSRNYTATAHIDDPSSLDRMLDNVDAVLNCAGPYSNTSLPIATAAIRNRVHYLDPNAVEQLAAKRLFDELNTAAKQAGVSVVPVMGIFGGLGDALADVASKGKPNIEEVIIAYKVDGWIPTRGSQLTSSLLQSTKRLAFESGAFREVAASRAVEEFNFGPEAGKALVLSDYPGSEIATVPRHLPTKRVAVKMTLSTIQDLASVDPAQASSVDSETRSKSTFSVVVDVRDPRGTTRVTAAGNDIYGITAPFMVNALELLPSAKTGVCSPSEAFGGRRLVEAVRSHGFVHELTHVSGDS
ncbi:saccharopine dehydrogenase NADP-binding domain-containing protein [Mesorhizobium loti]|uniref:Uncharacterized protein n=1 Tax=Rhizobium loti TaxID=381 RepID=A0A6M7U3R8_RHILI|nr:saccharopine dehydrogenase NADP-binding domain-containing protein [Mesorhizobium loti]OBQ62219.1 hypothetical protein A8145_21420 [Mesorhizobium loti]QKC71286.1 hypothetical protein EB815_20710 [Mesorhizobium loti]